MKNKILFVLLIVFSFTFVMAGVGFSVHVKGQDEVKGIVTGIKIVEVELTVKDDRGTETKVNTKDTAAFKLGDRVVIKDAKVAKEVKPITGGY